MRSFIFSLLVGLTTPGVIVAQISHYRPANNNYQPSARSRRPNSDDTVFVEGGKDNVGIQSGSSCPDPLFGIPFVYFEETGKCYLSGLKGPCPENMVIFPQHGSPFGFCDCNCDAYLEDKYHAPRSYCKGITEAGEVRSLAYVKRWGSCQPLLEQSKCPSGYWLAFPNDPKKGPVCERAVCEVLTYDLKFYDKTSGKCERLEGVCRKPWLSNRGASEGTYQIQDSDWTPICVVEDDDFGRARPGGNAGNGEPGSGKGQGAGVLPLNCPLGFRYSRFTGNCEHRTYLGNGIG